MHGFGILADPCILIFFGVFLHFLLLMSKLLFELLFFKDFQFEASSVARQQKTLIHEVGHAFGLKHPTCDDRAIMLQGYSPPTALTIQKHDEYNLKAKYN